MLRRKAKRFGKRPFKFRFIVNVHSVDLHHSADWQRPTMVVQWIRHARNVATENCTRVEGNQIQTHAEWEEALGMVVTLYKDEKGNAFEDKVYSFTLYETKGKKLSKQLASIDVNLAEHASATPTSTHFSLHMIPIHKKLDNVILHLTFQCEAAVTSDDASEFDAMSDASSVNFRDEDGEALETASTYSVDPETAGLDDASRPYEEQYSTITSELREKAKLAGKNTPMALEKLNELEMDSKSADQLRKIIHECRRTFEKEHTEQQQLLNALLVDYANLKVRLAQSEYDKEKLRLDKVKLAKTVANMKLKLLEQQQKLTKLEARLAKTG